MTADLILTNSRVITLNPKQPLAEAVAVTGDTISAVGLSKEIKGLASRKTRVVDCRGLTLLPGFVDAHCHLLAMAGALSGIDCGPDIVKSLADLQKVIGQRAGSIPHGQWIRGYGYDDESLLGNRHPTRYDLDQAAPDNPVRLIHRSGHALVLNSRALELAGIHKNTPDPVDGAIEREPSSGEPTGVLFEMSGFLRQRLAGKPEQERFDRGVALLDRKLLELGITSVQDAGRNNDLARWGDFQRLVTSDQLHSRITMMSGVGHLSEFSQTGMGFGFGDQWLRLGHAKIMLTMTTGSLQPSLPDLMEIVSQAHAAGFPVAIHAVEQRAVMTAGRAINEVRISRLEGQPSAIPADRIEHCSECPPKALELVRRSGASVVTQPGFVYWNGDRYLERVESNLLPHLYPVGTLHHEGVPVTFSSDAPVIDPNPWHGIYASVTRQTRQGLVLDTTSEMQSQRVGVMDALRMYTLAGAVAEGTGAYKGTIVSGKVADLVLVDRNPLQVEVEQLKEIRTVATIIGGQLVWEGGL